MPTYPVHTLQTASELSRSGLEQLEQAFGVLPKIAGVVANSPKLLNALVALFEQVHTSSLSEPEIQIVLLTDAVANSSAYAVAFHTALARRQGVSTSETDAIREGGLPADKRFRALAGIARALIDQRGRLSDSDSRSFFSAGFTEEQLLVVVAIIAASTITNYVSNIAEPPLDDFALDYAREETKSRRLKGALLFELWTEQAHRHPARVSWERPIACADRHWLWRGCHSCPSGDSLPDSPGVTHPEPFLLPARDSSGGEVLGVGKAGHCKYADERLSRPENSLRIVSVCRRHTRGSDPPNF